MGKIIAILALVFFANNSYAQEVFNPNHPSYVAINKCLIDQVIADRSYNNDVDRDSAFRLIDTPSCSKQRADYMSYCVQSDRTVFNCEMSIYARANEIINGLRKLYP